MIVRMQKGMDYSTATRNVKRAGSFGLTAQVIQINTGNADIAFSFEVELDTEDGVLASVDLYTFITEVLRYAHVAEVVGEWGVRA